MEFEKIKKAVKNQPDLVLLINLLLIMVLMMASRIFFYLANIRFFENMPNRHLIEICLGGIQFDRTAVLYTLIPYIALMLLPLRQRLLKGYQTVAKWIYVILCSVMFLANGADTAFFAFTTRRTTSSIFQEFSDDNNIGSIIFTSLGTYWYILIFTALLIFAAWKLYVKAEAAPQKGNDKTDDKEGEPTKATSRKPWAKTALYYLSHTGVLVVAALLLVAGVRGGFTRDTRPITLSNANQYVNKSTEAAIVLNTPFCFYRTLGKKVYKNPGFYKNEAEMEREFSPIVLPHASGPFKYNNVVIIILESFGKEYSGFFNPSLELGKYKGYTPFLDSLYQQGMSYTTSYATGRKSIDAMPSVLASIPMFEEPFILTPYSNNQINSLASELGSKGYYSAFFHGAPNGSMGFESFAKLAKYDAYFGKTEYDKAHPGNHDFDNYWGIWDEEFLQYFAHTMTSFKQPFLTSIFTVSSHHPFQIPERYKGTFKGGSAPLLKCIQYSDNALRKFFKTCSRQPWYNNTLFVITADHVNQVVHKEYSTDEKLFSVPILFYCPGDKNVHGIVDKEPVCQADIMPSVLGFLNYDKPYIAWGRDVLTQYDTTKYVVNYNNPLYQIMKGGYMLQFDGQKEVNFYNLRKDPMLTTNLKGKMPKLEKDMEQHLKAQVQQYLVRMVENRLTMGTNKKKEK